MKSDEEIDTAYIWGYLDEGTALAVAEVFFLYERWRFTELRSLARLEGIVPGGFSE